MSKPIISKTSRPLADGTFTLMVRFSYKGQKIREYLDVHVKAEDWDNEERVIRKTDPRHELKNKRIKKALNKTEQIIWIYELQERVLTQEVFKEEFWQKASREDFLPWMREEIQRQYNRRLINGYTKWDHLHIADKVEAFCKTLPYSVISRGWLERFDAWHAKQQEVAGYDGSRAREKALKCISKYLSAAADAGKEFADPFKGFTWPKWKSYPVWLEENEVRDLLELYRDRLLLEVKMAEYARRQEMRDYDIERYLMPENVEVMRQRIRAFLFQCFAGPRYSDLGRLRWEEHFKDGVLVFTPAKTAGSSGKTSTVPLTDMIMELALDGRTTPPRRGTILKVASNQKYNKGLKIVGALAGIDKALTSHVGRHTFGSLMIAGGVSVVSLMEMMGLTKIETALIYIHSSLEQQAREIKRAQERFLGSAAGRGNSTR